MARRDDGQQEAAFMRAQDRSHPAAIARVVAVWLGAFVLASVPPLAQSQQQQQQQQRRQPASYTAEQADAGFAAYQQYCAVCHGANLDDGAFAPPLRGAVFRETWLPRSVEALFRLTSETMPQDLPGSLDDATYTALVALMLQENGVEASAVALPSDPDLM
ncbi:MAG: cytochrome c, partial [Acidobacteria bacterium]|nr:cytochrome c [Acidobacteriota bacterium]